MALCDGDWALLALSGGDFRLVRARKGSKTNAGKGMVSMDPLIGAPYGANFRVERDGLIRDSRTVEELQLGDLANAVTATVGDGSSNAELFDDGNAQQLSDADIQRMKREGKQGAELIKAIAASSTTFAGKTAFAQEKYLKKKAKKHMPFVALLRPSPLTLCDFYMLKSPDKLLGLRRDTLALLLTLSNVQEGSRVLVLEQTLGLLAAAATQAAGSSGRVLALSSLPNKPPILDAPLADCFHLALQAKAAVRMQLVESFTRKYQVAENRTHPEMNTYPPTGYVLSGIAVCSA